MMNLVWVAITVYVLNIPFGYWRAHVRKFSLQWVLAIHIPVPIVIALRFAGHLGFQLYTYPILVGAFFLGQYTGSFLSHTLLKNYPVTSCLVMDIYQIWFNNSKY